MDVDPLSRNREAKAREMGVGAHRPYDVGEDVAGAPIIEQLDRLSMSLESLDNVLETLRARLAPVLYADDPKPVDPGDTMDSNSSPVSTRIMRARWQVEAFGEFVGDILRRLEV